MLAVYIYNSRGYRFKKKQALKYKECEIPSSLMNLINVASEVRSMWPKNPSWYYSYRKNFVHTKIPQGVLDMVGVNVFQDHKIKKTIKKYILPNIKSVADGLKGVLDANC